MLEVPCVDVLELIVLGRVFIGAGRVVISALFIDTSGGGSGFAKVLLTRLLRLELLPF